ncbi:uncharacterized protein LOC132724391, partial [Ruditapes philippinarum]|uniref:uncharacterized protein LOC132724391 n=1 Tax=Ruditapes philippinarum TaxID=129788 RepID=UPI00295A74E7
MEWIPRSFNERADYLSKIVDYNDRGISNKLLFMIKTRFGHLSVDWFASEHNAKLVKFYSRFWSPSSSGVDAFTENWGFEFGLFVLPITLIGKVIRKMSADQAVGVLVVNRLLGRGQNRLPRHPVNQGDPHQDQRCR